MDASTLPPASMPLSPGPGGTAPLPPSIPGGFAVVEGPAPALPRPSLPDPSLPDPSLPDPSGLPAVIDVPDSRGEPLATAPRVGRLPPRMPPGMEAPQPVAPAPGVMPLPAGTGAESVLPPIESLPPSTATAPEPRLPEAPRPEIRDPDGDAGTGSEAATAPNPWMPGASSGGTTPADPWGAGTSDPNPANAHPDSALPPLDPSGAVSPGPEASRPREGLQPPARPSRPAFDPSGTGGELGPPPTGRVPLPVRPTARAPEPRAPEGMRPGATAPSTTGVAPSPWGTDTGATTGGTGSTNPNPWMPGAGGETGSLPAITEHEQGTEPSQPSQPGLGMSAEQRAMAHATRLIDRPGDPRVEGYPSSVLKLAPSEVALSDGSRPVVLLFYDNASRESDLLAAELLPVLARAGERADVVPVNAGAGADLSPSQKRLLIEYMVKPEDVPVTVVLAPRRKERAQLVRFGRFPAGDLARVLLGESAAAPAGRLPGTTTQPEAPTVSPGLVPPTGRRPIPESTGERDPGLRFSAPRLDAHVRRLRTNAGDPRVAGYPTDLLRRAPAKIVDSPGHRPVVVVFYDDGARVSDLQAAELLPLLIEWAGRLDVVAIDVSDGARRTLEETQVVRRYYPGNVPSVAVLNARRLPVNLSFQRKSRASFESAFRQAVGR